MSQFTPDNNIIIEFHPSACFIKDLKGKVLLRGIIKHGLYRLADPHLPSQPRSFLAVKVPLQTLHDRLGHAQESVLRRLAYSVNLPVSSNKLNSVCGPCQLGKSRRLHLASSHISSSSPFELVYSHLWALLQLILLMETNILFNFWMTIPNLYGFFSVF